MKEGQLYTLMAEIFVLFCFCNRQDTELDFGNDGHLQNLRKRSNDRKLIFLVNPHNSYVFSIFDLISYSEDHYMEEFREESKSDH